jgi:eukaryotic-like serine/threonine-protein kinase
LLYNRIPPGSRTRSYNISASKEHYLVGRTIAHYRITAALGAGGMGEVYRAADSKLGRDVALKILPAEMACDPNRLSRFQREARAVAALNHPNIVTIFSVEEVEGVHFLTMELVEGEPLGKLIPAEGMPPAQVVEIAHAMADALAAAHEKGIIHRDLKPANLMVTRDGRVKILDFGLAKETRPASCDDITMTLPDRTQAGVVMGTPAYMSPEQIAGGPVDHRSDIFSLGVVLYEMATGQRPFRGQSYAELASSILRDNPSLVTEVRPGLPADLAQIVRCCLEKDPKSRIQTARDIANQFAETAKAAHPSSGTGAALAKESSPSVAVLPFANLSADPENEYFSDGLSEEIINALVQNPGLKVIARTSAFAFKGQNKDVRQIAEVLGVDHVLEGSVRKAGNRIRVTAQLITARDGSHLWSQRYDRDLVDIFAVQDEIAQAIAETLQGKLAAGSRPQRKYAPNLPAYEAVLKAWHHQWSFTPEGLDRGRLYYEQALQLDPRFARAHSGYAHHFLMQAGMGQPAREAMPQMREQAQAALQLDPSLAEAHGLLGIVAAIYDYDWQEAERRFRLALSCDPVPPLVRSWPGYWLLQLTGRARAGIPEQERALREDPLNFVLRFTLGSSLIVAGDYAEGDVQLRQAADLAERAFINYFHLTLSMAAQERLVEALEYAETAYSVAPWSGFAIGVLAGVSARTGDAARSEKLLRQLKDAGGHEVGFGFTTAYIVRRDIEPAAQWAARAIEQRDQHIPWLLSHPISEPLRRSAQWLALARSLNLPEVP